MKNCDLFVLAQRKSKNAYVTNYFAVWNKIENEKKRSASSMLPKFCYCLCYLGKNSLRRKSFLSRVEF